MFSGRVTYTTFFSMILYSLNWWSVICFRQRVFQIETKNLFSGSVTYTASFQSVSIDLARCDFFSRQRCFQIENKKTCFLETWHTMYAACFQWFSIHLVKGAFFQGGEVFKLKWKNLSYEILSYNNGILKWLWTINLTFAIIVHCGFDFCKEHAL